MGCDKLRISSLPREADHFLWPWPKPALGTKLPLIPSLLSNSTPPCPIPLACRDLPHRDEGNPSLSSTSCLRKAPVSNSGRATANATQSLCPARAPDTPKLHALRIVVETVLPTKHAVQYTSQRPFKNTVTWTSQKSPVSRENPFGGCMNRSPKRLRDFPKATQLVGGQSQNSHCFLHTMLPTVPAGAQPILSVPCSVPWAPASEPSRRPGQPEGFLASPVHSSYPLCTAARQHRASGH